MTRRVRAPGALAEQGGEENGEAAFPGLQSGKSGPQSASSSRGSSNGRTPDLTRAEMSVRIRRPELPNQWDRRCWKQRRSRINNPGIWPRSNDRSEQYSEFQRCFSRVRFGPSPMTDWARHEHPLSRQAN